MNKCLFCGKTLEKGKVYHDTKECIDKINECKSDLEKARITVGHATCGISSGADETYQALKEELTKKDNITLQKVGCSGMCHEEPIATVYTKDKTSIYRELTKDKVKPLIQSIRKNQTYQDSYLASSQDEIDFFKKQKRVVMRRSGLIEPLNLKQYIALDGFKGLTNTFKYKPSEIIEKIKEAGLRGRGGAGFPTGIKWGFLAQAKKNKILVVNADEGDPGAFMNRTLMESDPYQVLEGLMIAAYATGAEKGVIYTRAEYPLAISTLEKAIKKLKDNNLLGNKILGENFNLDVSIMQGAGAFVCGEETALMKSIEGKRGHPRPRPPYPAQSGINGNPTNINNVESYAHVSNIMANGVEWFKSMGSPNNPGTKCVCLTGKVKKSGVAEVELGTPIKRLIYTIGGGIKNGKKFKAVQTGGPSGGCVEKQELTTPLDYDNVPKIGTIMGSGGLVVMDEDDCMVNVAKFFLNFTTEESCGRCTPCREGTKRMLEILQEISKGNAKKEDLDKLYHLANVVKDSALCGLGQTAPTPVKSTIEKFRNEYLTHINDKRCPTKTCTDLVSYVITEKCIGCGNCQKHCPACAIHRTSNNKFSIDQNKCTKCGVCESVCPVNAVMKK